MYNFVQSCKNPQEISYRNFLAQQSVVSVVQEKNEPIDNENPYYGSYHGEKSSVVQTSNLVTECGPVSGKIDRPTPMSAKTMMKVLSIIYEAQGPMTAIALADKSGISENFCISWLKHVKGIDTPEEVEPWTNSCEPHVPNPVGLTILEHKRP